MTEVPDRHRNEITLQQIMSAVHNKHRIEMESIPASDFLVHTKHTCDVCFRQPIVGQRYTSGVHPNFDLCGRCFDAYRGPDIGLTEVALLRDKKHSRNFVLKLKIDHGGNVQVRRVNVSEIWDKSLSQLSFANLMSIAAGHAFPQDKTDDVLEAFMAKTNVTYLDGDGDTITMTSNAELEDSFLQVTKNFPSCQPFRIKVTVPRGYAHKAGVTHRFYGVTAQGAPDMTHRIRLRKIAPKETEDAAPAAKVGGDPAPATQADKLAGVVQAIQNMKADGWPTGAGGAPKPFVGCGAHGVGGTGPGVRHQPKKKDETAPTAHGPPARGATSPNCEQRFFVHARHTCDGCATSPIVGARYHATKIPDFDLCGACFEKYEGEDLDFQPEVNDRDRRMQQRWLKRQLKETSKMASNVAGLWSESNGDILDFLKKMQGPGNGTSAPDRQDSGKGRCGRSSPVKEEPESGESPPAGQPQAPVVEEAPSKEEQETAESPPATKPEAPTVEEESSEEGQEPAESPPATKPAAFIVEEAPSMEGKEPAESPPATKHEASTLEEAPESPAAGRDESFLSDADGSGSIAAAIGRTLDVCVQEIEKAIADEAEELESVAGASFCSGEASAVDLLIGKAAEEGVAAGAADSFSVASSMVSSMTEVLKLMDDAKKTHGASRDDTLPFESKQGVPNNADGSAASTGVPFSVTGTTILMSDDGNEEVASFEMPKVEDVSDGGDWSVISDDQASVKHDEDLALTENAADKSVSSVEPLSPVVLAKWDTELVQLHELGFLNDRQNIDVMEHLEASHMGVDSTEKVTVQNVVEHLLDRGA